MKIKFSQWIKNIQSMNGKCENPITKKLLLEAGFQKNFKIINIVGTNGKGTTAQYINDALIQLGYKVGKFTSPHIFKYNERITINNKEITDKDFYRLTNPYLEKYKKYDIMWFPITYITAMLYFYENNLDFVILEAGIGGEYDPTNVIDGDYGLVTTISNDHMDWFKTMKNVAIDKSGIINKDMQFFIPYSLKRKWRKIFIKKAKVRSAYFIKIKNKNKDYLWRNFIFANKIVNFITKKNNHFKFKQLFGRGTIVKRNNFNIIYDVSHNYEGIRETLKYLKRKEIHFNQVLISLSRQKDDQKMSKLFKVPIYIYKHSGYNSKPINEYKIKGKVIYDIKKFNKELKTSTLFIGSFFLLNDLFRGKNEVK